VAVQLLHIARMALPPIVETRNNYA